MNRLPLVRWDRCVLHDSTAVAYGWIARDDGRSDFVLLDFSWGETTGLDNETVPWLAVAFSTSSAKHSAEMSALLHGASTDEHKDCERITDVFGVLIERAA